MTSRRLLLLAPAQRTRQLLLGLVSFGKFVRDAILI